MNNETEQRGLLAYHRAQQGAAQQSLDQYIAEMPASNNKPLLQAMVNQQLDIIAREQQRIDDCLRNLGELPEVKPDVLIVPSKLNYEANVTPVEDVTDEETSEASIPEPTAVDEPKGDDEPAN